MMMPYGKSWEKHHLTFSGHWSPLMDELPREVRLLDTFRHFREEHCLWTLPFANHSGALPDFERKREPVSGRFSR
jgi:hypothetical protein